MNQLVQLVLLIKITLVIYRSVQPGAKWDHIGLEFAGACTVCGHSFSR